MMSATKMCKIRQCNDDCTSPKIGDQFVKADKCDKRILPQRSRAQSNDLTSHFHSNAQTTSSKNLDKHPDYLKSLIGVASITMQFLSGSPVVESVSCMLQQLKWGSAANEPCGKLNCSIDAFQANQILKQEAGCEPD